MQSKEDPSVLKYKDGMKKRLDDSLKELEDFKYALDEAAIVAITDQTGRITYVNNKFCEISKFSRPELIGQDHRIINSGFHSKEFIRQIWTTIAGGRTWHGELRNRAKDGSIYWVDTTIVPFVNEHGRPYQYVAIRYDITERKQLEETLQSNLQKLKSTEEELIKNNQELEVSREAFSKAFRVSPDALVISRMSDGTIVEANESWQELFGYQRNDVIGKTLLSLDLFVSEKDRERMLDLLADEGRVRELDTNVKTRSGKLRTTLLSAERLEINGDECVLTIVRDITERKASEERIRQQATLINKARDAIFVCDLNQKILFWNQGAERLYGWKSEEVLGRDLTEVLYKGIATEVIAGRKILDEKDEWNSETKNVTKTGKTVIIERRWSLVRNDLNQPDYILIINTDITEQKRTEEQLLRAQRMESIGTLAGGIAHDLNNILSPILMAADMLRTDPQMSERGEPWLSIIKENTERGADLIKQVLTFARGVEGEKLSVNVKHLVKEIAKILRETLPKSVAVKTNLEPELRLISADPTQIHQVLMNLCVNARDAMPDGGTLTISAENAVLDENYARMQIDAKPGNYILLSIKDTGKGMAPDIIPRIFDPFFTTKELGKGTGLGLSTALSIIKSHQGFVNVYSEPGRGTQFSVFLPATDAVETGAPAAIDSLYPKGNGELILLVDDEASILQIVKSTLEKYNYKTLTAGDGTEALALYAQNPGEIRLVLTDMAMPFMDGAATIRALRRINPNLPVIAASGLSTNEQNLEIRNLDVNSFLSKPYTAEKLLTTISEVLSKS